MSEGSFASLMEGVRSGDEGAIGELVQRYGPQLQRIARIRLRGSQLNRLVESVDICQSVMANFCHRAADGQFQLETSQQLLALLSTMTRNQVLKKVAFHRSHRRDIRRQTGLEDNLGAVPTAEKSPSMQVSEKEMLHRVSELLSADERYLLEQRAAGRSWVELASELGGGADLVRKRANRAAERVAHHFQQEQTVESDGAL